MPQDMRRLRAVLLLSFEVIAAPPTISLNADCMPAVPSLMQGAAMGRRRKYATDEERREAARRSYRKFAEANRETIKTR